VCGRVDARSLDLDVHGRSRAEVELGGGAAAGIAVFLLGWIVATWLGHPLLSIVAPTVIVVGCSAVPRLRHVWRSETSHGSTGPAWWAVIAGLPVPSIHKVSLSVLQPTTLPPGAKPGLWRIIEG